MAVPLLLSAIVLDADPEDNTVYLPPKSYCYPRNQSLITPSHSESNPRAKRWAPGIRKRRTTYVKAILANPKLTETQILARKFANEALRSAKVQNALKTLAKVKSDSQNAFGDAPRSLSVGKKIASARGKRKKLHVRKSKAKQKRKSHGKIRRKKSRNIKVGRHPKKKGSLIPIRDQSQTKNRNVEDDLVRRRIRSIGDPFEGESMIERLMRTTTRDPTKKNPGDQGIEYSEYYNDNNDPEDSFIYDVQPEFKDRRSRVSERAVNNDIFYDEDEPLKDIRKQKLYYDENTYNRRSAYNGDGVNNLDNLRLIPKGSQSVPENTNQHMLPGINEDYDLNVIENYAPVPSRVNQIFGVPYSYRMHNYRNPLADRFRFREAALNHISGNDISRRQKSLPGEEIGNIKEISEDFPEHRRNLQIEKDYGRGLNSPSFPFQTVSGGSAEQVWNFDRAQNNNYANPKDQETTRSSASDGSQTIPNEKVDRTTCATTETNLQKQVPVKSKAKGMKSSAKVIEEQKPTKPSSNETKEVANEILNRIIDELEDLKMDRAKKKHTEGLPCKLSGTWSSSQAGIKIVIKVANRTVNATFQKGTQRAAHRDFLNSTWNVSGNVPFKRGAPFSLIATDNTTKSMAVFIGTCRTCQGIDTIQGVWSVARQPKDCRDYQMSTSVFNDIFRKTNDSSGTGDKRLTRNDAVNEGNLTTITFTENSTRKDK